MHQNNLKIFYPLETGKDNKILRTVCEEVEKITPEIKEFGKILLDLMREYDGVGLAAPQIWENIRMIATTQRKKFPNEKNPDKDFLWETLLINPEIINTSKEMQISEEACLSLLRQRFCTEISTSRSEISRSQRKIPSTKIFWI